MKKTQKNILVFLGFTGTITFAVLALWFFGLFQYSVIQVVRDTGNVGDLETPFVSGWNNCQDVLQENVNELNCNQANYDESRGKYIYSDCGHYTFQARECRVCPNQNQIESGVCHLGCTGINQKEPCPENSDCYYPNGCNFQWISGSQGCYEEDTTTTINGRKPVHCMPMGIGYWEGWAQGCIAPYTRLAYATFIVGSEENLANEEIKFSNLCGTPVPEKVNPDIPVQEPQQDVPIITTPEQPEQTAETATACKNLRCSEGQTINIKDCKCENTDATTPPQAVICDLTCGSDYVPDYEKCSCVLATKNSGGGSGTTPSTNQKITNAIPKQYQGNLKFYLGIGFGILSIVCLFVTIYLLTRKKR